MSGIGFWELFLVFIIGLLILGPERLPRVASQIGRWVGRARRTANQLRYQLEREIALADIEKNTKQREADKAAAKHEAAEPAAPADENKAAGQGAATSDATATGESASPGSAGTDDSAAAAGTSSPGVEAPAADSAERKQH